MIYLLSSDVKAINPAVRHDSLLMLGNCMVIY